MPYDFSLTNLVFKTTGNNKISPSPKEKGKFYGK
jgi:hypothetical protein